MLLLFFIFVNTLTTVGRKQKAKSLTKPVYRITSKILACNCSRGFEKREFSCKIFIIACNYPRGPNYCMQL